MDANGELLMAARAAHAVGDWPVAFDAYSQARTVSPLETEDLAAMGSAAWWLGLVRENLAISEEVFRRQHDAGALGTAAMTALQLSLMWMVRGDATVGSAWISRARRILADQPESREHGYLLYLDAMLALEMHGTPPSPSTSVSIREIGKRHQEPALLSLSLVLSGLGDLWSGRTAQGFDQLDEAMLPVLANDVAPEWAGDIYCTVIHMCHQLGDIGRMRAWTDSTERWCETFAGNLIYTGICRVHRLELRGIEGRWDGLESVLVAESIALEKQSAWVAGGGYYQLGELHRLRGNSDEALRSFARARELGIDPQPGEALLLCALGRAESAWLAVRLALDGRERLARARLLESAVEIALTCGHHAEAEELCRELEQTAVDFSSPGFTAWAQQARAILLLDEGRPDEALALLQAASRHYRSIHARYETARAHALMARAHALSGQADLAAFHTEAAVTIFRELGAAPDVRALTGAGLPGGLTAREVEVLASVTAGASNRDTAARLFISEKTVGRHLSNIFVKIGVSSRTAAAAWAREHGLDSSRPRR